MVRWYKLVVINPTVELNLFQNYYVHILIPPNIETGEPVLKIIHDKFQYKDNLILNNSLSDEKLNQIPDMIK